MSKRFDHADYGEVLRQRLHRDEKGGSRANPATATSYDDEAMSTPLLPARRTSFIAGRRLWAPIISTLACVVLLPLASVIILDGVWAEMSPSEAPSVIGSEGVEAPADAPASTFRVTQGPPAEGTYAEAEAGAGSEAVTQFAELDRAVSRADTGLATLEVPAVAAPAVTLDFLDAKPAAARNEPSPVGDSAPSGYPDSFGRVLAPGDRDRLVERGNEMLARGDVSGARLVYRRAAEAGDARAANGLGRTFDAKVLQSLRVYGVRPDPDQAAAWYARSKTLELRASQ